MASAKRPKEISIDYDFVNKIYSRVCNLHYENNLDFGFIDFDWDFLDILGKILDSMESNSIYNRYGI